jgi:hypothetical protein
MVMALDVSWLRGHGERWEKGGPVGGEGLKIGAKRREKGGPLGGDGSKIGAKRQCQQQYERWGEANTRGGMGETRREYTGWNSKHQSIYWQSETGTL